MRYDVTYQSGGDQHTVGVDAENAAEAAQMVQQQHGHNEDLFELISVQLLDELPADHHSTMPGSESTPSSPTGN
ncbi:MAG: hypothetical protein ACR2LS_06270 [Thermomicrobiales bacterium]